MHNTRETMKSILLATASILAFAGAAAADVTFGGDATLGYNLDDEDDTEDGYDGDQGFFWEANLGVTLTQELNNGLTAGGTFTLNIADDDDDDGDAADGGDVTVDDDFVLFITGETGGLFFGDVAFAAETHWNAAGNMLADDFSEQDSEIALRGDVSFNNIDASVSYVVADAENDRPEGNGLDQLSLGASTTFGAFNVSAAYQEESDAVDSEGEGDLDGVYTYSDDFDPDEVFGISAGTTFSGADFRVGYASNMTDEDTSIGVEVAYPFGPVTLGAYYVLESDDASDEPGDDGNEDLKNSFGVSADYASGPFTVSAFYEVEDDGNETDDPDDDGEAEDDDENDSDFGVEGAFDAGNGLVVRAGYIDSTEGYAGIEYDLGGGAQFLLSYADEDEEGDPEYEEGITAQVSLDF
jgi:predicted porin